MFVYFIYQKTYRDDVNKSSLPSGTDDIKHKIVAVNLNWNDDEWNLNANDFDNVNPWDEGNVFLYPDTV
jgi:hypothetical protein